MREIKLKGSILPNTNKIISDSYVDWRGVKEGNLLKFKSDNVFYQASKVEPFFYIKDFFTIDEHTILIKDNTSIFLNKGDSLVISYKEHELLTVFSVLNGGRNYKIDDIVFLDGGVCSHSLEDGFEQRCYLRVAEILPGGIITKLSIENRGKYIEIPEKKCRLKGGNGTGAIIDVDFRLLENRALVERDILDISVGDETKINLTYSLPKGVKEGKISTEKYSLTIVGYYSGKQKNSEIFDVTKDFTPHFGWPLLLQNSFSTQSLVNHTLIGIDKIIFELKEKIQTLENKIKELEK